LYVLKTDKILYVQSALSNSDHLVCSYSYQAYW